MAMPRARRPERISLEACDPNNFVLSPFSTDPFNLLFVIHFLSFHKWLQTLCVRHLRGTDTDDD